MKRSLLFAACFVGVSVVSSDAFAFEKFTVGGGFMGAIGGSFQNKPGNKTIPGTKAEDTAYPGFGGFNGPFTGLFIEGRFLGGGVVASGGGGGGLPGPDDAVVVKLIE